MIPNKWPIWTLAPIAAAIVALVVIFGMVVEPAVSSVSPETEPTLVKKGVIQYSTLSSTSCVSCHTKKDELAKVATSNERMDQVYIDPLYLTGYHAQFGCSSCHLGNGEGESFDEAHSNLVVAPSYYGDEDVEGACITCHGDISERTINTDDETMHDTFLKVSHEDASIDRCSTCHGQVAHGSDPFVENSHVVGIQAVCEPCHVEQANETQLTCNDCHEQVHEIPNDCSECHTTDGWKIKSPEN